jgi:L-arabinose isomerase
MISARRKKKARVGLFGIGLAAYWPQFPGLKERLEGYQDLVQKRLEGLGAEVKNAGLVDNAPAAQTAGEFFCREDVDIIVCYVGTYATSSQVLPAVQRPRRPVLILNLQPVSAMDYPHTDTGEWLANCCACCVPEISCAFARTGIDFNVVTGMLGNAPAIKTPEHPAALRAWKEIGEWVAAASVVRTLSTGRTGFLGQTYPGMLDMYSDFTMHHGQLGMHIEVLEMCDLAVRSDKVNQTQIQTKLAEIKELFNISEDSPSDPLARAPQPESLEWSARVSVALDQLFMDFDLDAMTYFYRGLENNLYENLSAGLILGNTLLTAKGFPCAGEGDLKTCMAMLIMDSLNAGGSFTEFYGMDFDEEFILMGHDGPAHIAISDQKPILRGLGLFHGKAGQGVSVEMKVKNGPITLLGMTQTRDGNLKMLAAEGESIPGTILQIGNTNSRLRFKVDPIDFMNGWCQEGPTHHCALGVGHVLPEIHKIARLLHLELKVIG